MRNWVKSLTRVITSAVWTHMPESVKLSTANFNQSINQVLFQTENVHSCLSKGENNIGLAFEHFLPFSGRPEWQFPAGICFTADVFTVSGSDGQYCFRWSFFFCDHDYSWTTARSSTKFCTNMYLDNDRNQRSRSQDRIFGFFTIAW